jgi:hypothetical protein
MTKHALGIELRFPLKRVTPPTNFGRIFIVNMPLLPKQKVVLVSTLASYLFNRMSIIIPHIIALLNCLLCGVPCPFHQLAVEAIEPNCRGRGTQVRIGK